MNNLILTHEQESLIAHRNGPAMALTVAGAAKTTTMLLWADALVSSGVDPGGILLTTFSRLGASDMRARSTALGVRGLPGCRTIHSVAWEAIRSTYPGWSMPPVWWAMSVVRQEAEMILSHGIADVDVDGEASTRGILTVIERAKANLILPYEWEDASGVRRPPYAEWAADNTNLSEEAVAITDSCYRRLESEAWSAGGKTVMRGQSLCTHSDAISRTAVAILMGEEWVEPLRGRYTHVAVDEAQDVSHGQWVIIDWLARSEGGAPKNIMIVADDQQSIYSWRGASPSILTRFVRKCGVSLSVYPLTTNFRSGPEIIRRANMVLSHTVGRLTSGEIRCGRPDIMSRVTFDTTRDERAEAKLVADRIASAISGGTDPQEIAVLYRVNALSGPVEMELLSRGIMHHVAGRSFFSRPDVSAAVSWVALAANPDDRAAWAEVYRVPLRRIGRGMLATFPTYAAAAATPRGRLAAHWRGRLLGLVDDVQSVTDILRTRGLVSAVEFIMKEIGVSNHFLGRDGVYGDEGLAKRVLLACAEEAESVGSFLRMAAEGKASPDEPAPGRTPGVTLSTIHRAKGLEWEEVHLIGFSHGVMPLAGADRNEERRLCYVAVTRPSRSLRITCPRRSGVHASDPSQFAGEMRLCDTGDAPPAW